MFVAKRAAGAWSRVRHSRLMTAAASRSRSERRQVVVLTLGFWLLIFLVSCLPVVRYGNVPAWQITGVAAASLAGAAFCPLIWLAMRRTAGLRLRWRGPLLGLLAAGLAFAQSCVDQLIWTASAALFAAAAPRADYVDGFLLNLTLYVWIYGLYSAGVGLLLAADAMRQRERMLGEARAAADRARLSALRSQVNPHFLFNALNAATALVAARRNPEAEAVLMRLSEFFRASLVSTPGEFTTLEEEFEVAASYLDIEAARFGERLAVEFELPAELREAACPPVLLQPLVENAVKHGVARSKRTVTVRVSAAVAGDRLLLRVEDDGGDAAAPTAPGTQVGLQNVRGRLEGLFGERGRLRAQPLAPGYRVEVEMPLRQLHPEAAAAA